MGRGSVGMMREHRSPIVQSGFVASTRARLKSDLRNHQAIVQPRLYDSLMVTQITLTRTCRLRVPCHLFHEIRLGPPALSAKPTLIGTPMLYLN
jgi:hypothetical protein